MNRRHFLRNSALGIGATTALGVVPHRLLGANPGGDIVRKSSWAMGTQVSFSIPDEIWRSGVEVGPFKALTRVDRLLSVHQTDSQLSRLNASPGVWMDGGPELLAVSRAAREWGELTGGALDVTVLPLMRAYGFLPGGHRETLEELRRQVDFRQLSTRGDRVRIGSSFGVDLGGIAKGFGVDEAAASARETGVDAAIVEAGGDLYVMGRPSPDRSWSIGIRDPINIRGLAAKLDVENAGVATSGSYLQRRKHKGQDIGHILDPASGLGSDHVASTTIVAPTAMMADALATAASVLAVAQAIDLVQSLPGVEGLWILPDRSVRMTNGMAKRVTLL
ncbi:MAG: FAD:protein FMN transferase [Rhodothermales bacterium]|nr:FAD:protein FMN transferase [Rhodothermales bacterium]